jgi:hypothetical protein
MLQMAVADVLTAFVEPRGKWYLVTGFRMVHGRSVRLYLVDGSPTGIITAEIMNWTGHVLVAPRSRLAEALQRGEATRTGVYFLVGDDPEQPSKSRVYVGEGDSLIDRIKSHSKDSQKVSGPALALSRQKTPT